MNRQKFFTGSRVIPVGKRAVRHVLSVRRMAGTYEYILVRRDQGEERCLETHLRSAPPNLDPPHPPYGLRDSDQVVMEKA